MAVLLTKDSKVVVQGITGYQGRFHTESMMRYGTNIVAGVTPGRRGQEVNGVPVYDSMKEAVDKHEINTSIIFVPAFGVLAAAYEAIDAGVKFITIITEHVPVLDAGKIVKRAKEKGVTILGPNCPGLISPGIAKLGILPGHICASGKVGLVSRSGTLTYEIIQQLTSAGLGQSTAIGIGGDPVSGIGFIEAIQLFENDPDTEGIVMIGEIGGTDEEDAAEYIKKNIKKPVVAYIAGRTAPPGKQMGHAGAIISGGKGTAATKIEALNAVNVPVAVLPSDIPKLLVERM
ncbi:MAG: succinate--CoA ligase subunit alpha [Candidatus Heimdallarchaeota archaeon]|nr:succinate--CoA ligase subunit alpha [Candidatus Heimdallarchaeota archaeon]MCK5048480.1 succinate--CoA ligase subunit alpha [Candidatus Heimdallarchaeota archaeon]